MCFSIEFCQLECAKDGFKKLKRQHWETACACFIEDDFRILTYGVLELLLYPQLIYSLSVEQMSALG